MSRILAASSNASGSPRQEHNCLLEEFSKLLREKQFLVSALKDATVQRKKVDGNFENTNQLEASNSALTIYMNHANDETGGMNQICPDNARLLQGNSCLAITAQKSQEIIDIEKRKNHQLLENIEKLQNCLKSSNAEKRFYKEASLESKNHGDELQRRLTIAANSYKDLLNKHKLVKKASSNLILVQRKKIEKQKQLHEKIVLQMNLRLEMFEAQLEGDKKYSDEILRNLTAEQNKTDLLSKRIIELKAQLHEMQRMINEKKIENKELQDEVAMIRELSLSFNRSGSNY